MDSIYIVNEISSRKGIENGCAENTIVFRKIEMIRNFLDDFSLSQHMTVVFMVLQAVDIRFDLHHRPPLSYHTGSRLPGLVCLGQCF